MNYKENYRNNDLKENKVSSINTNNNNNPNTDQNLNKVNTNNNSNFVDGFLKIYKNKLPNTNTIKIDNPNNINAVPHLNYNYENHYNNTANDNNSNNIDLEVADESKKIPVSRTIDLDENEKVNNKFILKII
jgi:hypothetical protein